MLLAAWHCSSHTEKILYQKLSIVAKSHDETLEINCRLCTSQCSAMVAGLRIINQSLSLTWEIIYFKKNIKIKLKSAIAYNHVTILTQCSVSVYYLILYQKSPQLWTLLDPRTVATPAPAPAWRWSCSFHNSELNHLSLSLSLSLSLTLPLLGAGRC